MINDSKLVIDVVSTVLRLEEARAQVAAKNIAMANVPGARAAHLDISPSLAHLRAAITDQQLLAESTELQRQQPIADLMSQDDSNAKPVSLDTEVAEISSASGRYQALADGLSRQFALMQLAIGGGK